MVPVITSFLPLTHSNQYLPLIFKLWEAFNSGILDERFLEFAGELSEEYVAGPADDDDAEGGAAWKDIGIWTESQWDVLVSKGLGSMSELPITFDGEDTQTLLSQTFPLELQEYAADDLVPNIFFLLIFYYRNQGSSTTASHADAMANSQSLRIKKTISRQCV